VARRIEEVHCQPVCAVIESRTGASIIHDTLAQQGWSLEIADAEKVKGLAPLACKTDKIDSKVLTVLSRRATAAAGRGRAAGRAATETPKACLAGVVGTGAPSARPHAHTKSYDLTNNYA
jgi:hypothetical protein